MNTNINEKKLFLFLCFLICFLSLLFFFVCLFVVKSNANPIEVWLKQNEGLDLNIYLGPENNLLIGYGHNLAHGIDVEIAEFILFRDIQKAEYELLKIFSNFSMFSLNVRIVLIDMMCAMGPGNKHRGFKSFKKMIYFIMKDDLGNASKEIIDSKWARVYKTRAKRNSKLLIDSSIIYDLFVKDIRK